MSRKPGLSAKSLRAACEAAGIRYEPFPQLGSTEEQRDRVKATGDIAGFHEEFRVYAERNQGDALTRLAALAQSTPTALLCYERRYEDCHRMDIAELLADRIGAKIVAIE